ncbi:MAG: DNA-directed RNA polymerase subunit beta [Elusimicrobia bacterium]|nr:DNA-directed RNA polymerase subunit beta [Elusimicrobiota bacterium]
MRPQINFSKISNVVGLPNLLEMQKRSFREFLQPEIPEDKRKIQGLQASFMDVFPITNNDETLVLDFVRYETAEPRYSAEEARARDATYSAPVRAVLRLSARQPNGKLKEIVEQEIFLCDLPLMTENASFIINGAERVVVSQLHRSPGVIFEEDEEKKISSSGKPLYFARLIPYRGAWVEFEFDLANALYVRIDRKRKFPVTTFLRACGLESDGSILRLFYPEEEIAFQPSRAQDLAGRVVLEDVAHKSSGEVLVEAGQVLTPELIRKLSNAKIGKISVISGDAAVKNPTLLETLKRDSMKTPQEAQQEIYKRLRAQEFVVPGQAEVYLDNLIFKNLRKYDLGRVGRYKILRKLRPLFEKLSRLKGFKFETPAERRRTLALEDLIVTIQYLLALNDGLEQLEGCAVEVDDIDHLGNRRVRAVGELLENQVRVGLAQIARMVREKMNVQDKGILTPRALVNTAPVVGILRKFFGTSQLSQFMDQTNPLAELTHKRRLSALGPGGLNRKRAGFEVRDVHYTHYGRICPIETPEGPNIGLITSLACYARINEYGLIESPYQKVVRGKVTQEVTYLTSDQEHDMVVAQANVPISQNGRLASDLISCRYRSDYPRVEPSRVDFMDVSPKQVVSVSAALIPFLEHDDANRALMGSNMQRQAVPLLRTESPLVATGVEARVAQDSGVVVLARRGGRVVYVVANRIAVYSEEGEPGVDIYELKKFNRSNQDTCVNQIPVVEHGQKVSAGQVLADGPAVSRGQLALGKNLLVAFMPWEGFNFEDAILVSDRLVHEDVFTSIHIQEFDVEARDTKMGPEEITRDIPNVGSENLEHLDENGIVVAGTVVVPGDILAGKVTPKGEQQLTPEERLLKVIFGKKAEDVQDASLRVPPGVSGQVIDTRIFVRPERLSRKEEKERLAEVERESQGDLAGLREQRKQAFAALEELSRTQQDLQKKHLESFFKVMEKRIRGGFQKERENIKRGDELPVTVNKVVKVYVACKRRLQIGDKLAGRHGNKGVVAKVISQQDMPHLPDGTPVDMVLSPLSVPSRMNVGQLLETMLGWAAHVLDVQMVCPVFDGAKEEEITNMARQAKEHLRKQGVPEHYLPTDDCRITLYDGRTGEPFMEKATVGYMYLMKLIHLVEDKIHARSTGPYSLITRQPLGGKAQFGGQRFGEMEVWAVEGYGAAYLLQEFLTVKSDDVTGRNKMYEAIIKGGTPHPPGVPESFKVLVKELQALGLHVELVKGRDGSSPNGAKPVKDPILIKKRTQQS